MESEISKNDMIETLLAYPKSKQVFAFEEVVLEDLNDYNNWAIDLLSGDSWGKQIEEALLILNPYFVANSIKLNLDSNFKKDFININLFELKDSLRAMASALKVIPPKGKDATRLYCLGCLQDVVQGLASPADMLDDLYFILGSQYKGFEEFSLIPKINRHWHHPKNNESHADIENDFYKEAKRLTQLLHVKLSLQDGYWKITVENRS